MNVSEVALPNLKPFVAANDARGDRTALRALLDQNSYLFFRGLMDVEVLWQVRHDVLALCREAGWLDPDSPLDEGVWSGKESYREGEAPYMEVYRQVLKLPSFHQLPYHPIFLEIAEDILGGEVFIHPRQIGRITFPVKDDKVARTPPHQDWHFIRGTTETYTFWVPLGDCPRKLGTLAILAGSHRLDYQQHVPMYGTGGAGVILEEGEWHTTDFKIGDFVLFHSHTVHQGLPNLSGRYLRLSADNRYQRAGDAIDPSSLRPHFDLNLDD